MFEKVPKRIAKIRMYGLFIGGLRFAEVVSL